MKENISDGGVGKDVSRLTLGNFLSDVATAHAGRDALLFEGQRTSFDALEAQARELARALVGAGVVKGARVAVLMANRPEWVVSAFAVGLVGGVLVPVNTFATADELDYILRHSDASLLLMQSGLLKNDYARDLAERHPEIGAAQSGALRCPALPNLRRIVSLGDAPAAGIEAWSSFLESGKGVDDALLDAITSEVHPSDDGILIYTSGTTANPKGVLHTQRAGVIQSWRFADYMGLGPDDIVWTAQPFFWTAGIAMSLGPSLAAGSLLILEETFDAERALALMESEGATAAFAWPHQNKALAEHPSAATRKLANLRKIEFSNPLAPIVGLEKDEWGIYAAYGASETFTLSSCLPANTPAEIRKGSSGVPLPGIDMRIVEPESGEAVAPGSEGEIAVKGVTFMRGYYKVLPELYLDEAGFFRTQDGGYIDDEGHLHWKGRLSNMIKTGGANVSPLEIEAVIGNFDKLRVGMAVGLPHPTLGEVIVLCAVPAQGASVDEDEVRAFLRTKLAAYKVPKRVLFFSAEELSYTGTQKIQTEPLRKAALERLAAEGAEIDGYPFATAV